MREMEGVGENLRNATTPPKLRQKKKKVKKLTLGRENR